jgi:hypothetical protein
LSRVNPESLANQYEYVERKTGPTVTVEKHQRMSAY